MTDVAGEIKPFEPSLEPVWAPVGLLYAATAVLAVAALLLKVSGTAAHLVGYVLAAVATPGIVIWFRATTRLREREPLFVNKSWSRRMAAVVLVAAVAVAVLHGFYYSRSVVLA